MAQPVEAKVTEIQRLTLKPGDRLVIRVDRPLTVKDARMIKDRIEAQWPGVPVLVLDARMSVEVIGQHEGNGYGSAG